MMSIDFDSTFVRNALEGTGTQRLRDFHTQGVFYTPIEERFERITRVASVALRVPVAAITAVSLEKQWFKSVSGWNVTEIPMSQSLCYNTILDGNRVLVPDLREDSRYASHPFVVGPPQFRSYAGVAIKNEEGTVTGTFLALDTKPRNLDDLFEQTLTDLAMIAGRELLAIALHDVQSQLITKLSDSRRQALLDPLTRVWNRRGGIQLLEAEIQRAKEKGSSIAVVTIDLNDFKQVNDRLGHGAGDRALRLVTRQILASLRSDDIVCRLGGDEFFVVCKNLTKRDVRRIMDRVNDRIQKIGVSARGTRLPLRLSFGCALMRPEAPESAESLLEKADRHLYQNKKAGRAALGQTAAAS